MNMKRKNMLKKISGVLLLFAITIVACSYSDQPTSISKDGFQIIIPPYLEEDELTDDGLVEYANRYRNFYLVVVESTDSDMNTTINSTVTRLTKELKEVKIDTLKNESQTSQFKIKAYFDKEKLPIYYFHKILKVEDKYKVLTVWIRGEERKDKYSADIMAILESFIPVVE